MNETLKDSLKDVKIDLTLQTDTTNISYGVVELKEVDLLEVTKQVLDNLAIEQLKVLRDTLSEIIVDAGE